MVYETFLHQIKDTLTQRLGPDLMIRLQRIPKNNGLVLDGLCIGKKGELISPAIYLNPYYEKYLSGIPLEEIFQEISALYQENQTLPGIEPEDLSCFQNLRNKIVYKLVNADSNRTMLESLPHIPFLDLAVVFYLLLDETETEQVTALIHNEHCSSWNLSVEELYQLAKENTSKLLPARIESIQEMMSEFAIGNSVPDGSRMYANELPGESPPLIPLYVLTNRRGINGSCCLIYHDVLKEFAELMENDIIIIPSSIHEVLLIPDADDLSYEDLGAMVLSVNQNEVPLEDRLSNQVYLYSKSKGQFSTVSASAVPVGEEYVTP